MDAGCSIYHGTLDANEGALALVTPPGWFTSVMVLNNATVSGFRQAILPICQASIDNLEVLSKNSEHAPRLVGHVNLLKAQFVAAKGALAEDEKDKKDPAADAAKGALAENEKDKKDPAAAAEDDKKGLGDEERGSSRSEEKEPEAAERKKEKEEEKGSDKGAASTEKKGSEEKEGEAEDAEQLLRNQLRRRAEAGDEDAEQLLRKKEGKDKKVWAAAADDADPGAAAAEDEMDKKD